MTAEPKLSALLALVDGSAVVGVLLVAGRFFGLFTTFPLFSWVNLNGLIRVALAVGFAVGAADDGSVARSVAEQRVWYLLVLLAKEVAVGALLGVLLGLPVWAAQVAGDVLDSFRGANAANIFDPIHSDELTVGGQMNALIAMSCLVAIGGLPLVFEIVSLSFAAAPVSGLSITVSADLSAGLRAFGDRVVAYGMLVAGPLLVLMLLIEIAFAIEGRIARQFGLDMVSAVMKGLAFLVIIPIYAAFLYAYSESAFRDSLGIFLRLLAPA